MNQWERDEGTCAQYTVTASSHQNGAAERSIQTAENAMRALLDSQDLPIEFWDEAIEFDANIRNRLPFGPKVNGEITCPEQVYIGEKPDITKIRVWGSKFYDYVNPKTLPAHNRHDKLVLRGREGVFMGPVDGTVKQYKIYAPDLGYTRRTNSLFVDELVKGGTVKLRLRDSPGGPQGTLNSFAERKNCG